MSTASSKNCDLLYIVYLSLGFIAEVDSVLQCTGDWDCRDTATRHSFAGFSPHICWPVTKAGPPHFAGNLDFSEDLHQKWNEADQHVDVYPTATKNLPLNITVYAMNYNNRNLFGWLHIVIGSPTVANPDFGKVMCQVETEENEGATAGSLLQIPVTGSCKTVGPGPVYQHDFRPCSTATDPFPEIHRSFGRRLYKFSSPVYAFNVKLSFPLCSIYYDKNPIYFRTYVLTTSGISLPQQRRIYLQEYVFGSADPAPPFNSTPDCTQAITSTLPSWIQSVSSESKIDVRLFAWSCKDSLIRYGVSQNGRCCLGYDTNYSGKKQSHDTSTTFRHHCRRTRAPYLPFGTRLDKNAKLVLTNPEPEKWGRDPRFMWPEIELYYLQMQAEIDSICAKSCPNIYKELQTKGLDASSEVASYVWGGRQAHGILMAIACLFVYPVSNFMTRYFKGTYMNSRVVVNLHVWYSVHLYAIFTAGTLLAVSLGIAIYARKFLGYSDTAAGKTHVSMGYFALLFFAADFAYMGWRCGEEGGRNCAIFLHFLLGAGFYFTSLVAIITSIYVPGSPGSLKDEEKNNLDTGSFILLAVVVKLWPIFECVIHVFATLQLCRTDRKSAVLRDWAFLLVPIPRVAAGERHDEDGTTLRVCLLRLFVLCSLGATCIAVFAIGTSQPRGHLMGPMTLTHVDGRFTDEYISTVQDFPEIL